MSPAAETLALFGGIALVLVAASLFGLAIERRYAGAAPLPAIENLNARVRAWWVMAALFGAAFAFGKAGDLLSILKSKARRTLGIKLKTRTDA